MSDRSQQREELPFPARLCIRNFDAVHPRSDLFVVDWLGACWSTPCSKPLGIQRCGFHAFRHGNETVMGLERVPIAVRQDCLGHSDIRMVATYNDVASEDGRPFASRLGRLLEPQENLRVSRCRPGNA